MSLLAYNKTLSPLVLAAGGVTLPASTAAGVRSKPFNVTAELKPLLSAAFASLQAQVAAGSCEYEWTGLPEYNTFSLVAGSAPTDLSDLPIEIYVDPATGNDSNPGTPTSKVQTFLKAWSLMAVGRSRRRIFLAAGNYPITAFAQFAVPEYLTGGEPVCVLGTPVPSGLGTLAVTATVASTTGGARRGISAAPHVGNFQGAALLFTSGASAGVRMLIAEDDGTTFTLVNRVNSPVAPGDTFIIERPGSVLVSANGGDGFTFTQGMCAFKDVKFDMSEGASLVFAQNVQVPSMENVEIALQNGGFLGVIDGGNLACVSFDLLFLSPSPFSSALRATCGLYAHSDGTGACIVARGGVLGKGFGQGGHIFSNFELDAVDGGVFNSGLTFAHYNMLLEIQGGSMDLSGRTSAHSIVKGSLDAGFPAGIVVNNSGNLQFTEADLGTSLSAGIDVSAGGQALLRGNLSLGACAGYGISVHDSGLATIQSDGAGNSSCAITGTLNGVGDAIGGAAPTMTLTDAAGLFTAAMVGRYITLASATTPANNGTFLITGFTSATVISYTNNAGVAEAFAAGTWLVQADVKVGDLPAVGYVQQLNGTRGLGEIDAVLGPTGNRVNVTTF